MKYRALAVALLLLPAVALAQSSDQQLDLSQKATVEGATVPVHTTVSAQNTDGVTLSETNKEGAVPVTVTFYVVPKPKPVATSSQEAAAIESSAAIQQNINNILPPVETTVKPAFTLIDGARGAAADVLDSQLAATKKNLGPNPGQVLGAEATKNATTNPGGAFWYLLQTLYFYLLTVLRFIIGSAALFYPIFAILFLYFIWKMFRRFRRPAY